MKSLAICIKGRHEALTRLECFSPGPGINCSPITGPVMGCSQRSKQVFDDGDPFGWLEAFGP
jgi:hypothetical protein